VDGLESGMLREAGADTRCDDVQGSRGSYDRGGHDSLTMRRTDTMNSLASTVVFISQTDLRWLSPIDEDVSQGSENSSQRSSPVKTTEEGSSPNSSLIKREAGNLLNAQLMLVSKRFDQENLSRWFRHWRGGVSSAILERHLKKVVTTGMCDKKHVTKGGGASDESVEIQDSGPAKTAKTHGDSSQQSR
jgi:hypothetical protein